MDNKIVIIFFHLRLLVVGSGFRKLSIGPEPLGTTTQLGEGLLIPLHNAGPCIIYSPN